MGCTPSIRNNRLWRDSLHNSIVPIAHYPMVDTWTDSYYDSYNLPQRRPPVQVQDEPPPYTELPEIGHISLMHGSPLKPEDVSDHSTHVTANDHSFLDASTSSNYHDSNLSAQTEGMETEEHQEYHGGDYLSHSLGSHSLFRPVRASSPFPANEVQGQVNQLPDRLFPERPRSRSMDMTSLSPVRNSTQSALFPPRPALEPIAGIAPPLSPPLSLTPIERPQTGPTSLFPVRPDRLPPLQRQLSQPAQSNHEPNNRRRREERQVRTNGRKRAKRKRVHTWHGERIAPSPALQQDAINASTIDE